MSRPRALVWLSWLAALWWLAACQGPLPVRVADEAAVDAARFAGALAMPDRFSADAAQAVLDACGNAVDAGIAAAFVLAVTLPEAGNLGGGGFLLAHMDGEAAFLDYRETAPAAAHQRWGTRPWAELVASAVALPRFHHQLLPPDLITFTPSRPLPQTTTAGLRRLGYRVEPHPWEFGDVQVVWFDGVRWQAASDPRHRGTARALTAIEETP